MKKYSKEEVERGLVINQKKNNERLMKGKELNKAKSSKKSKVYV